MSTPSILLSYDIEFQELKHMFEEFLCTKILITELFVFDEKELRLE